MSTGKGCILVAIVSPAFHTGNGKVRDQKNCVPWPQCYKVIMVQRYGQHLEPPG